MQWHLITCEYPGQQGGVSDYTYHLARELIVSGDSVHVWCPSPEPQNHSNQEANGVVVHRTLGKIGITGLRQTGKLLNDFPAPRRLLVQWVPHGYGYRSMNLYFCLWLWKRAKRNGDIVDLMVHEPFLPFAKGQWKQNFAAMVHRIMILILLRASSGIWISIPAWEKHLAPLTLGRKVPMRWLPVPSNVPTFDDPEGVSTIRRKYASNGYIIGHFGTYDPLIAGILKSLLPRLLRLSIPVSVILFGKGSDAFQARLLQENPKLREKVHSLDFLPPPDLSRLIQSCDLLVQPFSEGVNSRRTTLMAGLAHGVPVISTTGFLTDPIWEQSSAVALVPCGDVDSMIAVIQRLLEDPAERSRLGASGKKLYLEHFDWKHTIAALQNTP